MFTNYFKIALRVLFRNKGYSSINIFGLAVGMACSMLILLWVLDELSYDRFHEDAEDIYRVEEDQFYSGRTFHVTVTPHPVGPAFKEEIPEIIDATRFNYLGSLLLRHGEASFYESGIAATDPSFFQMFSFPFVKGDPVTALNDPYSLVITEEMAEKHFAGVDPMGQLVTINNQYEMIVRGVIEDVPGNTYFQFDMLVPFEFMRVMGRYQESWGSNSIRSTVCCFGQPPRRS
ncbi:MAG: ABC transporter permease [Rhodothermales bacterium]